MNDILISLENIGSRIEAIYKELDLNQNWSFLYNGAAAFAPCKIAFVGLNPGGSITNPSGIPYLYTPQLSARNASYNAYLDAKDWSAGEKQTPLQHQIQDLYRQLWRKLSEHSSYQNKDLGFEDFMRISPAINYIPFRSQNWNSLDNKNEILAFCQKLWPDILNIITPSVVLVMSEIVYSELIKVYEKIGFISEDIHYFPTGWGKTNYCVKTLRDDQNRNVTLAKCPHLSRYKLFNNVNPKYKKQREKFINLLAKSILTAQ